MQRAVRLILQWCVVSRSVVNVTVALSLFLSVPLQGVVAFSRAQYFRDTAADMVRVEREWMALMASNDSMEHERGERAARQLERLFSALRGMAVVEARPEAQRAVATGLRAARSAVRASRRMDMAILAESERNLERACRRCHAVFDVPSNRSGTDPQ